MAGRSHNQGDVGVDVGDSFGVREVYEETEEEEEGGGRKNKGKRREKEENQEELEE